MTVLSLVAAPKLKWTEGIYTIAESSFHWNLIFKKDDAFTELQELKELKTQSFVLFWK